MILRLKLARMFPSYVSDNYDDNLICILQYYMAYNELKSVVLIVLTACQELSRDFGVQFWSSLQDYRPTSHSTKNRSLRRRSSQPISWRSTEETKLNTTKASNTRTKQSKVNQKKTHEILNLNKCTKTKRKPKPTLINNCSCVCAYHCAHICLRCTSARSALEALRNALYKFSTHLLTQLWYTTQHRTIMTIFPFILPTIIIA